MDTFEDQLAAVENALLALPEEKIQERASLEALKSDILQLLELTKQQTDVAESSDNMDNEMERFMEEISEIETTESDDKVLLQVKEFRDNLKNMIGQKCSAPHLHTFGATAYHNAIVCAVEDDSVELGDDGKMNGLLRILFTNPTHREMLPCSFFLEGHCRFNDEQCHFSHGELVPPAQLREYSVPDFENLARNYVVLAKLEEDRLWHRGRVICVNFIEKICRVRLDGKKCEQDFAFEDLFPIYHDEDLTSGSDTTDEENDSASEETYELEEAQRSYLIEQSVFTCRPTQPLGEWEKHTRGIGSKLMFKMGYIHGTGLGSDGRGIITPISAQILPQGCSLDHCMELRESANGDKDFFSAEKKIKRNQKKQITRNVKAYERESKSGNVFSFLNEKILSSSDQVEANNAKRELKSALENQSTKSLNIESVRIADDMRKKEREIATIQQSLDRNKNNNEMYKRLQMQLNAKRQELCTLEKQEKTLSKEQTTRKTKDKLCVF